MTLVSNIIPPCFVRFRQGSKSGLIGENIERGFMSEYDPCWMLLWIGRRNYNQWGNFCRRFPTSMWNVLFGKTKIIFQSPLTFIGWPYGRWIPGLPRRVTCLLLGSIHFSARIMSRGVGWILGSNRYHVILFGSNGNFLPTSLFSHRNILTLRHFWRSSQVSGGYPGFLG